MIWYYQKEWLYLSRLSLIIKAAFAAFLIFYDTYMRCGTYFNIHIFLKTVSLKQCFFCRYDASCIYDEKNKLRLSGPTWNFTFTFQKIHKFDKVRSSNQTVKTRWKDCPPIQWKRGQNLDKPLKMTLLRDFLMDQHFFQKSGFVTFFSSLST